MTRLLFTLTGLGLLAGAALVGNPRPGCAQDRSNPAWLHSMYNSTNPGSAAGPAGQPEAEPNQDLLVTPAQGPWMVCVHSYTGPEAPRMAREMVTELRGPNYNLPAFVFNYGADKRRQEQERVRELARKQREFLEQTGQPPGIPIRISTIRFEEQCAVLVGGFRDIDSARRALDDLRKLQPPDSRRVKLNKMSVVSLGSKPNEKPVVEEVPVNPFTHSFVVRNPSVPQERAPEDNQPDMAVLRRLNSGESFSLLTCPKPLTVAVSVYKVPTLVQQQNAPSSLWEKLGLGGKSERVDAAAHSAHNLAEFLRKGNIEAYVLHTRYASIVTVGAYETPNDPHLKLMKERFAKLSTDPRYQMFTLLDDPKTIQVPR